MSCSKQGLTQEKYKAHSTRGAATSHAKAIGYSAKETMERANWMCELTFKQVIIAESKIALSTSSLTIDNETALSIRFIMSTLVGETKNVEYFINVFYTCS